MTKACVVCAVLLLTLLGSPGGGVASMQQPPAGAAPAQPADAGLRALLDQIQDALRAGGAAAYLPLLAPEADRERASGFAVFEMGSGVTRAVARERDRTPIAGGAAGSAYRLMVDVFTEFGDRARVATWLLDVRRQPSGDWRIADQDRLSAVDNLFRLSVDATQQLVAKNFSVSSQDLILTLEQGSVFTVSTREGVTGLVLLGRGNMRFSPPSDTEKGQVRIFAGSEALETRFDTAFVRVRNISDHADMATLTSAPVNPRELRRAEEVFREEASRTFVLDLADLSAETWWLLPGVGDFVTEVRTRRFDTLTYARSTQEPEDVSLFNRRRQRNISVYASEEKIAQRGRFYHEDDLAAYDVLDYEIDLSATPERQWIEGRAQVRLRVQREYATQLTLRLAEPLTVHSIVSSRHGRLFHLRVRGQNTVLVNLPSGLAPGDELSLAVTYSGRLPPQLPDRETLFLQRGDASGSQDRVDVVMPRAEPSYLYSNRSYWYPQPQITDFATAVMRITVPATMGCVGTGELVQDAPVLLPSASGAPPRKQYTFEAGRPVRYLAFVAGRFVRADSVTVAFEEPEPGAPAGRGPQMGGAVFDALDLTVETHPLHVARGRQLVNRAASIARFYQSVVGDSPYPSFTLTLTENTLPGGHSPGYFAILNQPLPNTPFVWRTDPANFEGFPDFFLAHELAHQWWGQAVGWRNYHEQWLSEGFAQYFAALYAEEALGEEVFGNVLRQMRRWAINESDQGPVFLGYRLGHVRNESRVFRALVYNKGAAVLHMLRMLLGDDAFFRGLRRFYVGGRFLKVGTEDLKFAMEAESGQSLDRFFERWIYGASLPRLTLSQEIVAGSSGNGNRELVLHFTQEGDIFDVPVVVTLAYDDGRSVDVVVPVTDRSVMKRVPLEGRLRDVRILDTRGILADVEN